jgi:hypothetical protein
VPDPDQHYRAICAEIFGVADRGEPYADWHDERHSTAIPVQPPERGGGSVYRSPDLPPDDAGVDRDADTGPIPYRRPSRREDGGR